MQLSFYASAISLVKSFLIVCCLDSFAGFPEQRNAGDLQFLNWDYCIITLRELSILSISQK